ncbi:MAG: TrmH family RNA methyltransferase [Chloroflexota bacterium]
MVDSSNADESILEGVISIRAALRSGNRTVHALYISLDRDHRATAGLEHLAIDRGIPVRRATRDLIDKRTEGRRHGGVMAVVGPRRFLQPEDLLPPDRPACIAMLDGVEDPYNFGAAIRSLYAAGVDGLVIRPRNWMSAAGIVARSSGGASELMPTALVETSSDAVDLFEAHGLAIACTTRESAVSIYDADLTVPLFLLIGGEQRGISRSVLRKATLRLRIPYARGGIDSLGTSAATAALAFEIMRQRRAVERG